jgi:riboflavin kinase/FMN adenylyltransferase
VTVPFLFPQPTPFSACVAAIGNFDGVHAGHREVLRVAGEKAAVLGVPLVALTFEPHPRSVIFPDIRLKRLTDLPEKARLLAEAGAEGVAVMEFDRAVAAMGAAQFVEEVLVSWLGVKAVVVGENFRYGHKAAGDVASLGADGRFEVVAVPLVSDAGGVISSRRLRGAV